jgi:hypothetical protein
MGRQVGFLFIFSCGECGGAHASGERGGRAGVLPGSSEGGGQPSSTGPQVQIHGADVLCDVSTGVARPLVPAALPCSPPSIGWRTQASGLRDVWCRAGSYGMGAPQTWPDGAVIARPARGER